MMIDIHYIRQKLWYKGIDLSINNTADWIDSNCPNANTTEDVIDIIRILFD